jgi:hypothetical protein
MSSSLGDPYFFVGGETLCRLVRGWYNTSDSNEYHLLSNVFSVLITRALSLCFHYYETVAMHDASFIQS